MRDADDSQVGELRALERDLAILHAEEDIEEVGESLRSRQRGRRAGLGKHLGGAVRLCGAQIGRRAAR